MQQTVILWLAALPLVLAMFRAITIGDRLFSPVQQGLAGGHHKQLVNSVLAGLTFVGMIVVPVVGGNAARGIGDLENTFAFILMAFGAFILSAYMAGGFRGKTWQKFVGHVFHEAGLYWLVLGVASTMLVIADRRPQTGQDAAAGPELAFLELTAWGVISFVTIALIIGTASRMMRR